MDFNWFFNRGWHRNNPENNMFPADCEEQDFVNMPRQEERGDVQDVPYIDPFDTLEDTSLDLFQRMDDMLNRIFSASFTYESESDQHLSSESNPRAAMLKEPSSENFEYTPKFMPFESKKPSHTIPVDCDIDDKVAKHGWMLDESPLKSNTQPSFFYKKFSSMRTVRLPDGTLEEHRSVTDSEGNTTTRVFRSLGNQSYEVTTQSDKKGIVEKQENFTNMDQSELPDFEKQWQNSKSSLRKVPALDIQPNTSIPNLTPPTGDPSYTTLFKKFFGF